MYWETDDREEGPAIAEAVDVIYRLQGRSLPGDYIAALARALSGPLAPLTDLPGFGVKVLHLPASGNGWSRTPDECIYLSRRVRLLVRVPRTHAEQALALVDTAFQVSGADCRLGGAHLRELEPIETLYASRVAPLAGDDEDEATFMAAVAERLKAMGVRPRKMLPGRTETLLTPDGAVRLRSLMVAEMGREGSLRLQSRGLGTGGLLGCGLFVPHKAITELE